MISLSGRFRYYLGFTLLALLGVLLAVSAQAQELSAAPARARAYPQQFAQELRLQPHQYTAVYRCTLTQVQAQDTAGRDLAAKGLLTKDSAGGRSSGYSLVEEP